MTTAITCVLKYANRIIIKIEVGNTLDNIHNNEERLFDLDIFQRLFFYKKERNVLVIIAHSEYKKKFGEKYLLAANLDIRKINMHIGYVI